MNCSGRDLQTPGLLLKPQMAVFGQNGIFLTFACCGERKTRLPFISDRIGFIVRYFKVQSQFLKMPIYLQRLG